ncbi:hypothetical protein [Rhodococcus sp. 11-3]|uniref:hypothetical protein n=1 Tax=Rhodococcus TaxID=1827 RepID=UPI00203F1348|nr:hypothetical protein [Rhodococcus sp. 11-3]
MRIWMLVDLEPSYERLHVGDTIEGTTEWCLPHMLPPELISRNLPAHVERVPASTPGGFDRVAHLGDGVSALLPPGYPEDGRDTVSGCLLYDRYLGVFHRTVPTARGRIVRRGWITQLANRTPTRYPGWYSVHPSGPPTLWEGGGRIPAERTVTWDCVLLDTQGC